jgi:hypothetical protein
MKFHIPLLLALAVALPAPAAAPDSPSQKLEELDEVVVQGRVPGPPLWKISKGDHVLWILPLVDIYPKNIDWDSTRVERLLAGSQEYLYKPRNGVEIRSEAPGPLASLRALTAYKKIKRLASGQKLSGLLPADLYQRLLALQKKYFPRTDISNLTIWEVRRVLEEKVLDSQRLAMVDYSELTSPPVITTKLYKWLNKARMERRTNTSYFETINLESAELGVAAKAMEKVVASPDVIQWEVGCLEKTIAYFEKDFAGAKRRANAWAQGYADDLLSPNRLYTASDACRSPPLDLAARGNPELEQFVKDHPGLSPDYASLDKKRREHWLAEAERALADNAKTFGVLTVNDILEEGGLVATMKERGYKVEVVSR